MMFVQFVVVVCDSSGGGLVIDGQFSLVVGIVNEGFSQLQQRQV